ncbi:hypothetical protein FRC00_002230 [Tulasnella sp. 408]|nr:hypothetical protein FRC00_002230 [Tulasnella sp. 408]
MSPILLHNDGIGQTYNLFTPLPEQKCRLPTTNDHTHLQSALIMSKVMRGEGRQFMDLLLNGNSTGALGYAICKNIQGVKLRAVHLHCRPKWCANDAQVQIAQLPAERTGGSSNFSTATSSTSDKFNLTWQVVDEVSYERGILPTNRDRSSSTCRAGEPLGTNSAPTAAWEGEEQTHTLQHNAGTCAVTVKAPQFALGFFENQDSYRPR